MSSENMPKNPFACLFRSTSQVEREIETNNDEFSIEAETIENEKKKKLSIVLERIFQFTLDNDFSESTAHFNSCLYIGDEEESMNTKYISINIIDGLLLKRLQITEISERMIRKRSNDSRRVVGELFEKRQFFYLFNSIKRLKMLKNDVDDDVSTYDFLFELCINMSKTVIELNMESEKNLCLQLIDLINHCLQESTEDSNLLTEYLNSIFKKFEIDNDTEFIKCLFDCLNEKLLFKDFDYYSTVLFNSIDLVILLTNNTFMKFNFLQTCFPKHQSIARNWQSTTLLGKFLTPHFLPVDKASPYQFLQNPIGITQNDLDINQANMWQRQHQINLKQIQLFKHFLVKESNEIRNKLLEWIGDCLFVNRNKAQEWSKFTNNNDLYASDGFFLNLLVILLDLAAPFSKPFSQSLLKIDPTYSLVTADDNNRKIHFKGYDKETKLCKFDDSPKEHQIEVKNEYNFITECFYATHKCFQMSFISLNQKLIKVNQELSRTQSTYEEMRQQFQSESLEPVRQMRVLYEKQITEYLNIKASLTQVNLVEISMKFFSATSTWFAYLCTCKEFGEPIIGIKTNDVETIKRKTNFSKYLLSMIPEFFLTNINEFIIFLSRFQDYSIDLMINESSFNLENDAENDQHHELNPLMLIILIFMGNTDYVFNPYCRAQLAECLEALLPSKASNRKQICSFITKKRELLFENKICVNFLPDALFNVFVSIEMTGQAVQFEQKFNYRRPMYEILEYIWTFDSYKNKIKKLAKYAKDNIENSDQPLFLRFVNLLINDSNYLLLEGLLYLEKIKIKQEELQNFSSQNPNASIMNNQERNQFESSLKHLIMLAKFHNIMSTKTLHALRLLTTEMGYFFCETILVDRVATMLNDFLLHLVGSKQRNLKVNNFKEVEFNPQDTVSTICDIYLNLGVNEEFCKAVCRDGRSYSKDLFILAINVLEKLKKPGDLIQRLTDLGKKIEEISRIQQEEDSSYDDAPEEFLDPIMSHLMVDPVRLPSSKKVVDRSTISRILLSDQLDPFNREPLTLQQVIPEDDLKRRIEEWKASKRAKSN